MKYFKRKLEKNLVVIFSYYSKSIPLSNNNKNRTSLKIIADDMDVI